MKTVLAACSGFVPGYKHGGPVRSLVALFQKLADEFEFRLITADRDRDDPAAYDGIVSDSWTTLPSVRVYYRRPGIPAAIRCLWRLRKLRFDVLYLNSLFDFQYSILLLFAARTGALKTESVVIAPRGELSAGALSIKPIRKNLFIFLVTRLWLYRHITWQASTIEEAHEIKNVFGEIARVLVARDLVIGQPTVQAATSRGMDNAIFENDVVRVSFLSRVTAKKNLQFALATLAKVKNEVEFDIYGPIEDIDYWSDCEHAISRLPPNVRCKYIGSIPNEEVISTLSRYDIFFLPTLGENFGHVFVEAWCAGLMVLVSDTTPWRDLASRRLGWDIALEKPEAFVDAIAEYSASPLSDRQSWRAACVSFGLSVANDPNVIDDSRRLFFDK